MAQNWLQISILFSFDCMVVRLGAHNLTQVLMQALMHERGLTKDLIGKRLVTLVLMGFLFSKALG